jgi:hypothetical protein
MAALAGDRNIANLPSSLNPSHAPARRREIFVIISAGGLEISIG